MKRFFRTILASSAIVTMSLFGMVGVVSALGCQYTEGGATRCEAYPPSTQQAEATTNCIQRCVANNAQTGCAVVSACPGGTTGTPVGGSGSGTTGVGSADPEAFAKVTRLDNPISTNDIQSLVGSVVGKTFGVIGTLAVAAFIYGGFLWLTAAGNEEKVKKGGQTMVYATIGIVVIFSSFAILNTLLTGLTKGTAADAGSLGDGGTAPLVKPESCATLASRGFGCRPIDTCSIIIDEHRGKTNPQKRSICDANRASCFTGICPGDATVVCCR